MFHVTVLFVIVFFFSFSVVDAAEPEAAAGRALSGDSHLELPRVQEWLEQLSPAANRGYRHLLDSVYLPADLDETVALELQKMLQARTANSGAGNDTVEDARRRMLTYYGLTPRPGDELAHRPLQYVVTERGEWVMNCFACHGGAVYGTTMPGAPNNAFHLQSFVEDIRTAKLRLGKPLGHMEVGSIFMPLGTTAGTTNAVMFGVALMHFRDAELNVLPLRPGPPLIHHDMDAPAWWLMHRKTRIYADGFAQKGHRGLMQFMLVRENGPERFREWEEDFRDVLAFIEALRPPKFTGSIDTTLAERGRVAFNEYCSRCHGTYGSEGSHYPELLIPIEEIGTDRVRLDALSTKQRAAYGASWFAHSGEQETWEDPQGYMAPPLDGIWASAPYFHNGSVPTLWHVLHPDQRPKVWRRTAVDLDVKRIGLTVEELVETPRAASSNVEKREYFDTARTGKSADGHNFPLDLTEEQRTAVLEYLKTL
jgi:hypothetical protein